MHCGRLFFSSAMPFAVTRRRVHQAKQAEIMEAGQFLQPHVRHFRVREVKIDDVKAGQTL